MDDGRDRPERNRILDRISDIGPVQPHTSRSALGGQSLLGLRTDGKSRTGDMICSMTRRLRVGSQCPPEHFVGHVDATGRSREAIDDLDRHLS